MHRLKRRIVDVDEERDGRVYYTVVDSEATPSTNGRSYSMSAEAFHDDYAPTEVAPPVEPEPVPVPEPPADFAIIAHFDGTVKERDGHAFGLPDFSNWYDHSRASDIAVVDDVLNASGKALQFTYPTDDSKAGSANAGSFTGGPYREVIVRARILHERGWEGFGNKFFYLGAQAGQRLNTSSPTQFYIDRPGGSRVRVVIQNGASVVACQADNVIVQGRYQDFEWRFVAESVPGAGDGAVLMSVDGRMVCGNDAVRWNASAFDGMEWYGECNRVAVESVYRLGELYIAGRK